MASSEYTRNYQRTPPLGEGAPRLPNGRCEWCVPGTDGAIGALLRKLMEG